MDLRAPGDTSRRDPDFRSGPPAVLRTEPPDLPQPLDELLAGAAWELVWVKSGTEVWRVTSDTVSYLKIGPAGGLDGIVAERNRLAWLDGRQATPRERTHVVDGETGWLLTAEVPGIPGSR